MLLILNYTQLEKTQAEVEVVFLESFEEKKNRLISIIRSIIDDPERPSSEEETILGDMIRGFTPMEILDLEKEFKNEGLDPSNIHVLCDVHLGLLKEFSSDAIESYSSDHPFGILLKDHKSIIDTLKASLKELSGLNETEELSEKLDAAFARKEVHMKLEEELLFAPIKKNSVSPGPIILMREHEKIRYSMKLIHDMKSHLSRPEIAKNNNSELSRILRMVISHQYKESTILFKIAADVFDKSDWWAVQEEISRLNL